MRNASREIARDSEMPCSLSFPIRLCSVVLILASLSAFCPQPLRADDAPPELLSTAGQPVSRQWKSLAELKKAAKSGNAKARYQLGLRYETGDGVKQDYKRARALYEQAAAGGVGDAIYRLGRFYQNGFGVETDPSQARDFYHAAALANVPLAQYNLGAMLVSARGVRRDYVEGLAWLILAGRNHIEADGEKRVRDHLADQPKVIAAAEERAEELAQDVAAHKGVKPEWPPPDSEAELSVPAPTPLPVPAVKPTLSMPKFAPPSIELAPPAAFAPPAISDTTKP
jgi:hypothetical protein